MSTESRADRRIHGDNSPCQRHRSSTSLKRYWMQQYQRDLVRDTATPGAYSAVSSSSDVTCSEGSKKAPPMQPTKLQQLTTVPLQLMGYALNLLTFGITSLFSIGAAVLSPLCERVRAAPTGTSLVSLEGGCLVLMAFVFWLMQNTIRQLIGAVFSLMLAYCG